LGITPALINNREWEPGLSKIMIEYLKSGNHYMEIGPHIGYFTMLATNLVGHGGLAITFEANPNTFELLEKNTRLNNRKYLIENHNIGISNTSSILDFNKFTRNSGSSSFSSYEEELLKELGEEPEILKIKTISLDEFFKDKHYKFDFIKIDAEGSEKNILEGGKWFFDQCIQPGCIIYLEINPPALAGLKTSVEELLEIINSYGFNIYKLEGDKVGDKIETSTDINTWCITEALISKKNYNW
jgi:FkbM family methyltransferase